MPTAFTRPLSVSLFALLAGFGAPAFAQQAQVALPEINVQGGGALTVPTANGAREIIQRTPGAVAVIPDGAFKDSPAATIKDIVDYVPGVFAHGIWRVEELTLPVSGRWEIELAILISDFEMRRIKDAVVIRP